MTGFLGAGAGAGLAVTTGFLGAGAGLAVTTGFLGAGAGLGVAVGFLAATAGFFAGAGAESSACFTGLDVDRTPEIQQVSDRFGGTPDFKAHIAFGPFAPGHEYVHARHLPSFLHAFSHKSGLGADSSIVL